MSALYLQATLSAPHGWDRALLFWLPGIVIDFLICAEMGVSQASAL